MKIRIQDNSIRFRLTLREVDEFARAGRLERRTAVLGPEGPAGEFVYCIERATGSDASEVVVLPNAIAFRMGEPDRARLLVPEEEGAYVRREWTAPDGTVHRFMAFVEKDRPGSTCIKPEAWIYDAPPNGPVETRPIPSRISHE